MRAGKTALMMSRAKEWCKQNPGKKVLIAKRSGSCVLSYYAGSKVLIYSTFKEPEWKISIDEWNPRSNYNWVRERFLNLNA